MNLTQIQNKLADFFVTYGLQIVGALIILIGGVLVAKWIGRLVHSWLGRIKLESPVRLLLVRTVRLVVMAFALVLVAAKLGVDIAPLVAGIGVVGVGIGLATQGVLSNMVAGLLIIFTKPFRVGEYIQVVGVEGEVKSIELFATTLLHADLSHVVIPNRKISGEILHNYGAIRQVDLTLRVAYDTDLDQLDAIVREVLNQNSRVLKEPAPIYGLSELEDSEIVVAVNPWVAVADFAIARTELYRTLLQRLRAAGIQMPFPQHEVRLLNAAA